MTVTVGVVAEDRVKISDDIDGTSSGGCSVVVRR